MYFEKNFSFQEEAFDKSGNVYPFYILDVFEKSATEHGEILGVGEKEMKEKKLFWIISGILIKAVKSIIPGEELTIKTWPLKPNRLNFQREYIIFNSLGEEVIKGSANWLTMERETRKIYIGGDVFPPMKFADETNFGGKIPRLRAFDGGEKKLKIVPEKKHIDLNGHVNNKYYTTFVVDAIGELEGVYDSFQIEYAAEIMPDDKVDIFVLKEDAHTLVKGVSDKHNFSAKIIYKN